MIEHPIPQNITSYQFHLVGDMTLKQFLELAGGIFVSWLIWTLNLPSFLKWPMAIGVIIFGFALAFLPVEERPLDQWVLAFLRAIYRPTQFIWKKRLLADPWPDAPRRRDQNQSSLSAITKAPSARLSTLLEAYQFASSLVDEIEPDPLEKDWTARQQTISILFKEVQVPKHLAQEITFPQSQPPVASRPSTTIFLHPLSSPVNPDAIIKGEIMLTPRQLKIPPLLPDDFTLTAPQTNPSIELPDSVSFSISPYTSTVPTASPLPVAGAAPAIPATAAVSPALPNQQTIPNIASGAVFNADGRLVAGAIIEIRDSNRLPVRALKTNKLGQFSIATPLADGVYELEIEKEGLTFDILKLEAKGSIIPPIEIRAK